jgi:phosphatidylethanolamine-binding protein (PEBP) family uncharacterized protein
MHPVEALLVPLGRAWRNRRPDETSSIVYSPELATGNHFLVTSSSFDEGQEIPAKFCGPLIGDNVSPALAWSTLPAATKDLLMVMEDIDTPTPEPGIHTIAVFAPIDGGLAEGAMAPGAPDIQFLTHRNRAKYVGPRPMPGHGPHVYRFHLYALDTSVDLGGIDDVEHLLAAVKGHVLASGMLTGMRTS